MAERISMIMPELSPEVQKTNREQQEQLAKFGFRHIGSLQNGGFKRGWHLQDFREQIAYLRSDCDPTFFTRVILQDKKMRETFVRVMNVDVNEFWKNDYIRDEQPELTKEEYLEKHFWKALAVEVSTEELLKKMPDDFLLETLKAYNRELERIKVETMERVAELSQEFLPDFQNFTEKHDLKVNWFEIKKRFNTVSYDLFDQYYREKIKALHGSSPVGDYDPDVHQVRVEVSPFSRVQPEHLQHELVHAVSGRTNQMNLLYLGKSDYVVTRSLPRLGARRGHRFTWLNEAITEDINIDIQKDKSPDGKHDSWYESYDRERELFALVLKNGQKPLAPRLFYQAYFESDTGRDEDLVARKELYEAISEAYGSPRFLAELDDLVRQEGVKKAVEIFKAHGVSGVKDWWQTKFVDKEAVEDSN